MVTPSPELAPILDRVRARLVELPPGALHEAGIAANTWVATSFDKRGIRKDPIGFTAKFKDGAAVVKALTKGSLDILECGLWVLEVVDRAAALDEALAICALPRPVLTFKHQYEKDEYFDSLVRARAAAVVSRCVDLLPLARVLELLGRGDASFKEAAIAGHPELQSGEAILAALQKTGEFASGVSELAGATSRPRDADFAFYLLRRLTTLRYEPAVPVLATLLRDARHDMRAMAGESLLAIGSPGAFEPLAKAVEDGLFDADDPNLPLRQTALRGLFRLDRGRAYDRLARYLDEETITAEPAKTMMLAVIQVLTLDRRTRREGDGPSFYDADPRWAALIERMASRDPQWERYAWNFQDLSLDELDKKIQAWERRNKPPSPAGKKGVAEPRAGGPRRKGRR
jgi:HEAT repeat protein